MNNGGRCRVINYDLTKDGRESVKLTAVLHNSEEILDIRYFVAQKMGISCATAQKETE